MPKRVTILAAIVIALPALAFAQTATIEGTVKDTSAAALPDVKISVRNLETGWEAEGASTAAGTYHVAAIPPGLYRLTAESAGFANFTREPIRLFVGQTADIPIVMAVGGRAEEVTITAEAPLVTPTRSEITQVVEGERIQQLPLDGRNFLELAELAPGVAPSTGFGGGLTSISGFSFRNVTINLDGLDVTDVVARGAYGYFTSEPIREFQVITNRFSAEYGRSLSGVINAVTKSGTNELHGSAYAYARDEALDARHFVFDSETLDFEREEEKDEFSQQQFGASLGGPIVKDRTHFFLNYERGNHDATAFVTADPGWSFGALDISSEVGNFPQTTTDNQIFAKLNHQAGARHALEASFTRKTTDDTNVFVGGFSTASFGARTEFAENLFLLGDTWTVSNRAVNQLRIQFGTRRNDWIPNDRDPSIYQYTDFGVITCCGSHPSVDQLNQTRRVQIRNDFNLNRQRHNLKFGGDVQFLQGDHDTRYTSTGFYVIWYGSPLYFRQAFGPTHFKFDEEVYGIYAQDDWRLRDHLTLNLGVRYEYNTFTPDDTNNAAPRLGFAWDATRDGRTNIRGGVGLYHDLAFTQLVQVANWGGPQGAYNLTFAPGDPLYPQNFGSIAALPAGRPIPARDIYELDDDIRTAQSWQTSLGFQREIFRDLAVSVDGVYVRGANLLRLRDINAPVFTGPYPAGQEVALANRNRPTVPANNGFRRVDQIESSGRSEYKALYANLTKRLRRSTFQLSYTLADAKDDLPVGGDYNSRPNDSLDMDAEWGPALNDIRHTVAANAVVQLPLGFTTGGIFLAYSGRPYTAQVGVDLNGDGSDNDRPLGVGKGTLKGESFSKLDLFVNKAFSFGRSYKVNVRVEAFNALDRLNETAYGNLVDTETYQRATSAAAPRSLQLSARFEF
jgi:hypothetical protein